MTRVQANVTQLVQSMDSLTQRPSRYLASHPRARVTAAGMAIASLLALVLIPVRDSIGTANIALALVVIVGIVGSSQGIGPGLVMSVWAAMLFSLLHSVPHGHPRVEDEQDILTAGLLIAAGAITGWAHNAFARLRDQLQDANYGLARVHRVAEAVLSEGATEDVMSIATDQIAAELSLLECRWERSPTPGRWRELRHNGLIAGTGAHTEPDRLGELLEEGVEITMGSAGSLILAGRPGHHPSPRQLKVAVILADFASAAAAAQSLDDQAPSLDQE